MEYRIVNEKVLKNFLFELGIYDYKVSEYMKYNGSFSIEIKPAKRSLPQNNLFHKWVGIIAEKTGETLYIQKMILKVLTWGVIKVNVDGKEMLLPHESRDKNRKEFCELMNVTEKEANKLGIILPQPEHYGY